LHRKLPLVLTLAAWLFATGSHWDMVQAFAWARMLTTNAQTMSLDDAFAQTFSPEGRCSLCEAISAAKQQQDENGHTTSNQAPGKTVLVYLPAPPVVIGKPDSVRFVPTKFMAQGVERPAPLLTPPRV
jgi:hypothetical protein